MKIVPILLFVLLWCLSGIRLSKLSKPLLVPIPITPSVQHGNINYNLFYPGVRRQYNRYHNIRNWASEIWRNSAIVDVAVVCDKEFSDLFDHNRTRMLDYWTLRFQEINLQFMTLPSIRIAFRITSVTIISAPRDQPFIEMARNQATNMASEESVLQFFSKWAFEMKATLPRFQLAMLATNASRPTSSRGRAHVGSTCATNNHDLFWGTMVVSDNFPTQRMIAAVRELAHGLGAEHDDANSCKLGGHIMMSQESYIRTPTFSHCSDLYMANFLRSGEAFCLPKEESSTVPVIDPDYDNVLPPTLNEQCAAALQMPDAIGTYRLTTGKCRDVACWPINETLEGVLLTPNENTNCEDGKRCFLGKCVEPGSLLINVGSGHCLQSQNRFENYNTPVMSPCPRSSTPFDRFYLIEQTGDNETKKFLLATPLLGSNPFSNDKKCLASALTLYFGRCDITLTEMKWEQIQLENREFLLHSRSGNCIKHTNSSQKAEISSECNKTDASFRWKFYLIYPTVGLCGNTSTTNDNCTSDLHVRAEFRHNVSIEGYDVAKHATDQSMILDIFLENLGEAAIAPAVEISWKMNLYLRQLPRNCISFYNKMGSMRKYKCKVGRLLHENETVLAVTLTFNMSPYAEKYYVESELEDKLIFKVRATTASRMLRLVEIQTLGIRIKVKRLPNAIFVAFGLVGIGAASVLIFLCVRCLKGDDDSHKDEQRIGNSLSEIAPEDFQWQAVLTMENKVVFVPVPKPRSFRRNREEGRREEIASLSESRTPAYQPSYEF